MIGEVGHNYIGRDTNAKGKTPAQEGNKAFSDYLQTAAQKPTEEELWAFIRDRKEEILQKLKNGDTEETFQIGGRAYTLKEWDEMLEKFDEIQEIIRELMREEKEKQEEEELQKNGEKGRV